MPSQRDSRGSSGILLSRDPIGAKVFVSPSRIAKTGEFPLLKRINTASGPFGCQAKMNVLCRLLYAAGRFADDQFGDDAAMDVVNMLFFEPGIDGFQDDGRGS
jgi:hypothetical protein